MQLMLGALGAGGGRGGQRVERQRPAIKPQSACFIFTVSKFINIYYILTIYNTFYTGRGFENRHLLQYSRKRHTGKGGKKSERRQLKAKDYGSKGVRVSSPTQTRGVKSTGRQELGGLLAVRATGLAPQSEGRGAEGKGRWDSQSSREIL